MAKFLESEFSDRSKHNVNSDFAFKKLLEDSHLSSSIVTGIVMILGAQILTLPYTIFV